MAMFGGNKRSPFEPAPPFQIDGIGGPMNIPSQTEIPPMARPITREDQGKMPVWKAALGGLFDSIAQQTGGQATFIPAMLQQRQQEQEQQNAIERWKTQYDYERAHPKPINNDTANDYAFWQSKLSPEEFAVWRQNKVDPPQYRQGPDGQFYRVSPTAPPPITADDWEKGQPLGGPASAPGSFRIPSGNPLVP